MTVVMLCVCTKRVCVCYTELVCKTVRLACSCQTSAISLPFILIPCLRFVLVYPILARLRFRSFPLNFTNIIFADSRKFLRFLWLLFRSYYASVRSFLCLCSQSFVIRRENPFFFLAISNFMFS